MEVIHSIYLHFSLAIFILEQLFQGGIFTLERSEFDV